MIKRVINTNISLQDAFSNMIEASVANILIQKGIENGDASPVTDLGDVKKKGSSGKVVNVAGGTCSAKTKSGEIVTVTTGNGIYDTTLTIGNDISFDYDENGEAYLLNTIQSPFQTLINANEIEILGTDVNSEPGMVNIAVQDGNDVKSRIILQRDGIDIGMNSETLGGLIIIEKLTAKLKDLTDRLIKLELKYNAHVHPAPGGATSPTASTSTDISSFPNFNRNQYENKNVTHS